MIQEVSQQLPVLCALIVANIAAGTANSLFKDQVTFDKQRMVSGVIRAIVAIAGMFALAYAFDTVDLTGIGFTPMTIISIGIITYAAKLGVNLVKIAGLEKYIKIANPLDNGTEENG